VTKATLIESWLIPPMGSAFRHSNSALKASLMQPSGYQTPTLPNHSLKRSANGMSRWPSSAGPAAHFALPVQRALPLSPA